MLRQHLPKHFAEKRLCKVETLRCAIEYISYLEKILGLQSGKSQTAATATDKPRDQPAATLNSGCSRNREQEVTCLASVDATSAAAVYEASRKRLHLQSSGREDESNGRKKICSVVDDKSDVDDINLINDQSHELVGDHVVNNFHRKIPSSSALTEFSNTTEVMKSTWSGKEKVSGETTRQRRKQQGFSINKFTYF